MLQAKTSSAVGQQINVGAGALDEVEPNALLDVDDTSGSAAEIDKALNTKNYRRGLVFCSLLAAASTVVAIGLGPAVISPDRVLDIIGHHLFDYPSEVTWKRSQDAIIWDVRFPRVLLGAIVGVGLAVSGVALQSITRNPLAEPHILGVNAGASVGAALSILFGVGSWLGGQATPIVAFGGALAAMLMVLALSRTGGAITPGKMIISGVAVSYLLSAVTSMLVMIDDSDQGARAVMFWLLGSLARADWMTLPFVAVVVGAVSSLLWYWRRRLDVLAVGDETARSVGVDPKRTRWVIIIGVSLMIGAVVATSGGIGFVGLAVPHIARRFVGVSHRLLIPASAALGAFLLVWSDVAARMLIQPREIPIGVVTGLIGAPILVILVRRLQSASG